jgi:hypothetical protein
MKSKLRHDGQEKTFALVFDTGDEGRPSADFGDRRGTGALIGRFAQHDQ